MPEIAGGHGAGSCELNSRLALRSLLPAPCSMLFHKTRHYFVALEIRFAREFKPAARSERIKTMEFCREKLRPLSIPQFATHDCFTTCVDGTNTFVDKTQNSSGHGDFCDAVRRTTSQKGASHPIASSVQASKPQIAGFLLFSIATCMNADTVLMRTLCVSRLRTAFRPAPRRLVTESNSSR